MRFLLIAGGAGTLLKFQICASFPFRQTLPLLCFRRFWQELYNSGPEFNISSRVSHLLHNTDNIFIDKTPLGLNGVAL